MTTMPSWLTVWKRALPLPSSHIFTVSSSPGMTGFEKRASMTLNLADVGAAQLVQQRPTGEAVRAEAVEDRPVEARELGERRVGVQRVAVAVQAVEQRLVGTRRVRDLVVGLACPGIFGRVRQLVARGSRSRLRRG